MTLERAAAVLVLAVLVALFALAPAPAGPPCTFPDRPAAEVDESCAGPPPYRYP